MPTPIFEDDLILAVSKESGLPSESQDRPNQETAETLLARIRPDLKLHLLHRLDTGTSGVLLFAKSKLVYDEIRLKFKDQSIEKHYLAWCNPRELNEAPLTPPPFTLPHRIELPLAHHAKSKKRMIALPSGLKRHYRGNPLPALTLIHEIAPIPAPGIMGFQFRVQIKSGVMHQIRVHLAHLGFPILGDPLYAKEGPTFRRLALHAERMSFELRGYQYHLESKDPQFL